MKPNSNKCLTKNDKIVYTCQRSSIYQIYFSLKVIFISALLLFILSLPIFTVISIDYWFKMITIPLIIITVFANIKVLSVKYIISQKGIYRTSGIILKSSIFIPYKEIIEIEAKTNIIQNLIETITINILIKTPTNKKQQKIQIDNIKNHNEIRNFIIKKHLYI